MVMNEKEKPQAPRENEGKEPAKLSSNRFYNGKNR
jgi:hypothetical protein